MKKMRTILTSLILSVIGLGPSQAEIYADFTVSQGSTSLGSFRARLDFEKTPRTCANFIGLATGEKSWIDPRNGVIQKNTPYYDGIIFHRLIHNFVIQGGDPIGTGSNGPGYVFQDEFDSSLRHNGAYKLSMAHSGTNTNGSQFFITLASASHLDDLHTVFGEVISHPDFPNSRKIIDDFMNSSLFPIGLNSIPLTPITMDSVVIVRTQDDAAAQAFDISDPSHQLPTVREAPVSLRYSPNSSAFDLVFDRQDKWDYPLFFSTDLTTWTRSGATMSMGSELADTLTVTGLTTENNQRNEKTFFNMSAVDYSLATQAPSLADITAPGSSLALTWSEGTLTLSPAANNVFNWSFNNGVTTTNGSFTDFNYTNNNSFPILPSEGIFFNSGAAGVTYGRYLSIRQLTGFLDSAVGVTQVTAIQPLLSFHTTTSGWFDGAVNSAGGTSFRGTFIFTPAL